MRTLFALLLLNLAALGASNVPNNDECPRVRSGCLHKNDVNYILNLWARIHDTEDAAWLNKTIDCIVAEDFQSTNEGSMVFGITNNGIDIPDRATLQNEMLANIEFEAGYPITRGHYTEVMSFHSCDQIAFRWQYNGNATGKTKCTSTSNTEYHAFQYKGIDLLTIKKGTMQVEKVTTSADGVIYSLAVGADFTGSSLCPGTAPPPQDKTCPPIGPGEKLGILPPCEPHDSCPS